jgi:protein-disulfide isomerase
MNRSVLYAAIVAVLALGGVGYWYIVQGGHTPAPETEQTIAQVNTDLVQEMALGDPNAPITMIEYASFTCPHCASTHLGTIKELKKEYVDTGKVYLIYREAYFDRFGLWAAMVARCNGPESYFGMVDLIYKGQREWARGEPGQIVENLKKIGRTAGMSDDQLNACLQDEEKAKALNAAYDYYRNLDGYNATPSFVIDGELQSNMSLEDFRAILDAKLGE